MSVPLTLVLALPSVAALTRTHLIAPDPAVLLCEHIWYLEDEIEKIWVDESHPDLARHDRLILAKLKKIDIFGLTRDKMWTQMQDFP